MDSNWKSLYRIGGIAALNIILNGLLIPVFGTIGAALATAMSMAAWNLIMIVFITRRLGLNPTVLSLPLRPR